VLIILRKKFDRMYTHAILSEIDFGIFNIMTTSDYDLNFGAQGCTANLMYIFAQKIEPTKYFLIGIAMT
jgi:hypothetical protein